MFAGRATRVVVEHPEELGSRAVRVTTTTRIACPPEDVFDMLADLRNDTQWNSRVSRAELRSPEPIGLGSRFAIVNGGTAYDVTITTYDRPSRLVFEASGKPDLTIACTFTPTADGTELEGQDHARDTFPSASHAIV
jgi:uncharacterized protein YndB with AHSA1/START domain